MWKSIIFYLPLLIFASPGFSADCSGDWDDCFNQCWDKYNKTNPDRPSYYDEDELESKRDSCVNSCGNYRELCYKTGISIRSHDDYVRVMEQRNRALDQAIAIEKLQNKALCIQNCRTGILCNSGDNYGCWLCLSGC